MSRAARLLTLFALSLGACLVGVELMITAVALPAILADLADWTELRRASWIINAYLLAYVAVMPLAGRAADRYALPVLFGLALAVFAAGSLLAGAAPDLDWLIGARIVQGAGAGAIVPLATAGASHLFEGNARARAIGVVGALTFVGMALGPFLGALVLQRFELTLTIAGLGLAGGVLADALAPAWRWIFYLGAPLALLAGLYVWAAAPRWHAPRTGQRLDVLGAGLFTTALAAGLLALTLLGTDQLPGALDPALLAVAAAAAALGALLRFARASHPFIELRLFRNRTFSGAVLLSLLTGYGLATAIIGGAVFVDRVRYDGPAEQQLALGALAGAVAIGALASGLLLRLLGIVPLSVGGLLVSICGLLLLAGLKVESDLEPLVAGLALFGMGFGLTVTARSTAAVEAVGRAAFGLASAAVTVARMIGMAVGLAALTVLGSNRIEALSVVLVDQAARDAILPPELQGRPLQDLLVVNVLEAWAAEQAASILGGLFLLAAGVTALAILPTLAMRGAAVPLDEPSPAHRAAGEPRAVLPPG
ncbi:MAG TPA: MFS transporter [Candidatus Limnocylindria bacterium]|nr:MFS transporter [Candidatus Limnocylindria bacterium]